MTISCVVAFLFHPDCGKLSRILSYLKVTFPSLDAGENFPWPGPVSRMSCVRHITDSRDVAWQVRLDYPDVFPTIGWVWIIFNSTQSCSHCSSPRFNICTKIVEKLQVGHSRSSQQQLREIYKHLILTWVVENTIWIFLNETKYYTFHI